MSHDTKQKIIAAAIDLLAVETLEGLTTHGIAKAVGVTQPALFRHFRSREEILVSVVEETRREMGEVAAAIMERGGSATDRLRALVTAILSHVESRPGIPRLLWSDALRGAGKLKRTLRSLVSMQRTLMTELVREGQGRGLLSPRIDAELAATALIGVIQGLVLQWHLEDRKVPLAARADPLFALWLSGVGAGSGGSPPETVRPRVEKEASSSASGAGLRSLDVRPILARGIDPLQAILTEVDAAGAAGLLRVTAPFRPAPLIALMKGRGHKVEVKELGKGMFAVEISGPSAPPVMELSDLEPPEPMERVLESMERIPPGGTLLARLPRNPRLLQPVLRERGLAYEVLELEGGGALLLLRRPS